MNEIHQQYKKRKKIYFGLIAALFGILIIFSFIAPSGEHQASPIELLMFAGLIGIIIAIYKIFRCPKCNATLVSTYSSSWGKLHYCPKCGVKLDEKSPDWVEPGNDKRQ
jgi:FtsH-binding integral membrane protein